MQTRRIPNRDDLELVPTDALVLELINRSHCIVIVRCPACTKPNEQSVSLVGSCKQYLTEDPKVYSRRLLTVANDILDGNTGNMGV